MISHVTLKRIFLYVHEVFKQFKHDLANFRILISINIEILYTQHDSVASASRLDSLKVSIVLSSSKTGGQRR